MMTAINVSEEFTKDWDWYAHDNEGRIGHFTSGGLRALPQTVKQDREGAERVIQYFSNEASELSGYSVRGEAEQDAGGWQKTRDRDRFLTSFVEMARKGTFSYNTQMLHGRDAKYYLVAKPEHPLRLDDLPPEIRKIVSRTRAPISFASTVYVSEADTLTW